MEFTINSKILFNPDKWQLSETMFHMLYASTIRFIKPFKHYY